MLLKKYYFGNVILKAYLAYFYFDLFSKISLQQFGF